jgi:hypothetical protein
MPREPALRNTCRCPRTSLPQRAFHPTDHVQQDIHPTDNPPQSARKSGVGEARRRVGRRRGRLPSSTRQNLRVLVMQSSATAPGAPSPRDSAMGAIEDRISQCTFLQMTYTAENPHADGSAAPGVSTPTLQCPPRRRDPHATSPAPTATGWREVGALRCTGCDAMRCARAGCSCKRRLCMLLTMVLWVVLFKVRDFIKTKVFTRFKGMGGWVGGGIGGRCVRYGWIGGRRVRYVWIGGRKDGWIGGRV